MPALQTPPRAATSEAQKSTTCVTPLGTACPPTWALSPHPIPRRWRQPSWTLAPGASPGANLTKLDVALARSTPFPPGYDPHSPYCAVVTSTASPELPLSTCYSHAILSLLFLDTLEPELPLCRLRYLVGPPATATQGCEAARVQLTKPGKVHVPGGPFK